MEQVRKMLEERLELHPIDVDSSPLNDPDVARAYYDGKRKAYEEILDKIEEVQDA